MHGQVVCVDVVTVDVAGGTQPAADSNRRAIRAQNVANRLRRAIVIIRVVFARFTQQWRVAWRPLYVDTDIRETDVCETHRRPRVLVHFVQPDLQLITAGGDAVEQLARVLQVGCVYGGLRRRVSGIRTANADVVGPFVTRGTGQQNPEAGVARVGGAVVFGVAEEGGGEVQRLLQEISVSRRGVRLVHLQRAGCPRLERLLIGIVRLGDDLPVHIDQLDDGVERVVRAVDVDKDIRTGRANETVHIRIAGFTDHPVDVKAKANIVVAGLLIRRQFAKELGRVGCEVVSGPRLFWCLEFQHDLRVAIVAEGQ